MDGMSEDKTRVDFNAPTSLVERADSVADLLGVSRTALLIDALRDEIDDLTADEQFQQRVREAYYTEQIDFETAESVLGTEEAMRLQLLRASLNRDPPEPAVETDLPSQDEFYDDGVSTWVPDEEEHPDGPDENRA